MGIGLVFLIPHLKDRRRNRRYYDSGDRYYEPSSTVVYDYPTSYSSWGWPSYSYSAPSYSYSAPSYSYSAPSYSYSQPSYGGSGGVYNPETDATHNRYTQNGVPLYT